VTDELWRRSALELAELIRTGQASAREVVEAHLRRIDEVNPELNAVVVVLADRALAEADEADRRSAAGDATGPLHGVPVTIKENLDVAGTATTQGVKAFEGMVAPVDATLVARLRAGGAIVIGRTNLPDMGLRVSTDSSLRGLTRNPWHPGKTAGGSSGGEASALASGMSPLGVGNDIGGSLRNPAHCCGISSLKPTPGRVPHTVSLPPEDGPLSFQMMAVHGPMARSVADLRQAFELMIGSDWRDPAAVSTPLFPAGAGGPVRVALMAEPPGCATDPGVAAVVRAAGAKLAGAGFAVEEASPPDYAEALELWADFLFTELHGMRPLLEPIMGDDARRFLFAALDARPPLPLPAYIGLFVQRRRVARAWSAFLREYPVVLSPVWTRTAFDHGWDLTDPGGTLEVMHPIKPANVLGLPSAVTFGGLADGLPVGVQCIAAPHRDDQALQVAEALQAAVGTATPVDPFVAHQRS
jgi:amidase